MSKIICLLVVVVGLISCKSKSSDIPYEANGFRIKAHLENYSSDDIKLTRERIEVDLKNIKDKGLRAYQGDTLLTGCAYGTFYDWDPYFENIYLSYFGESKYCFNNTKFFLNKIIANGFIPRSYPFKRFLEHYKPFLAQMALLGSKQEGDYSWLNEVTEADSTEGYGWYFLGDLSYYERLQKYLDHWMWYMDYDKNGLPVWNGAGHSGMDNHFSRCGVANSFRYEGVDLACYLYREFKAMVVFAHRLGYEQDEVMYEQMAANIAEQINSTFWDDEDKFYYDRDERTGELVKVKSVAGFMPLFAGVATPSKAKAIIENHLMNPDEFWSAYPIPGYTMDEEGYHQGVLPSDMGCNWMGTTWIPANYMICHGLCNYGYKNEAVALAQKTFEMVLVKNETTREYYNAETGKGIGLDPFWGWSTLGYFLPLEMELDYHPTALNDHPLDAVGTRYFGVKF